MVLFGVVFNTKDNFVKDPKLRYEGGKVFAVKGQDTDFWSYFEARDIMLEHDEDFDLEKVNLWWMHIDGNLEEDIKPFKDDKDAVKMSKFAVDDNNCDVELYVEPKESKIDLCVLLSKGKGVFLSKGKGVVGADVEQSNKEKVDSDVDESQYETDEDSSDDSVKDVHFDDSQGERAFCLDDGFDDLVNEVPLNVSNQECAAAPGNVHVGEIVSLVQNASDNAHEAGSDGGKMLLINNAPQKSPLKKKKKTLKKFNCEVNSLNIIIPDKANLHDIDDEYLTDEMDSASDVDTDGEGRPPIVRFNSEEVMTKTFKFEVGMEFSSLKQFKDAILEHSVLNSREIKFVKNDKHRCRVVCKKKTEYRYLVFCSRVVRTTTFKVKTLKPKHTCGMVIENKNAKSKWVVKKILERMTNDNDMKLDQVIDEGRTRYSTDIPACRAFRARQIATQLVEGDSSRQYSLLWSYSAELHRASSGNRCKLEIDRPSPGLQPRFRRYYMCFDGCKRAINACRPFIGLDGCHLKNKYGGIILIVVGRDPNDQYLPLAFAVVETESKDTWDWFMTLLLDDIGDRRWCFISDQQKGLVNVFENKMAGTEHRFCVRHLYANFKKKFGDGTLRRDLMMGGS